MAPVTLQCKIRQDDSLRQRKPYTGQQTMSNGLEKPKNKGGPPLGSVNAQRHGMRGGKLPKGCGYIENRVNSLRRTVEAAILEAKGEISLLDAAAVNTIF